MLVVWSTGTDYRSGLHTTAGVRRYPYRTTAIETEALELAHPDPNTPFAIKAGDVAAACEFVEQLVHTVYRATPQRVATLALSAIPVPSMSTISSEIPCSRR